MIFLETARWGDYRRSEPYGLVEFEAELDRLMREYFVARSMVFASQLPEP
jgi:hypothetical protein